MSIRVITACLTGKHVDKAVLDGALSVAKRFNGHIDALFAHPDPRLVMMMTEEGVYPGLYQETIAQMERQWSERAAKIRKSFEAWRQENDVRQGHAPGVGGVPSADWREATGSTEEILGREAKIADLTVAALPSRKLETPTGLEFDAILFGARRPVLLVPGDGKLDPTVGPAVIAWNGSPEALHAVTAALPILQNLDDVSIFSADEGGVKASMAQELVTYLAWHGVDAHPLKATAKKGESVGESLLAAATGAKAHLLVMGAYTHSRVRETLFGGVTKHIFTHAKVPVLMAH